MKKYAELYSIQHKRFKMYTHRNFTYPFKISEHKYLEKVIATGSPLTICPMGAPALVDLAQSYVTWSSIYSICVVTV